MPVYNTVKTLLSRAAAYLAGGFNMPTEAEIESAPLVVESVPVADLFTEEQIDSAQEPPPANIPNGPFSGTLNTPSLSQREEDDLDRILARRSPGVVFLR